MTLSPLKAIKKKCKEECCVFDKKSWIDCTITQCPLWIYRFGKLPKKSTHKVLNESTKKGYSEPTPQPKESQELLK
jgi:hypothetical protein